ncbi:MAG: haloacid dehalogenase type II [Dehalococcoidia bacterium]
MNTPDLGRIRGLNFDFFGTVVDWRGSIIAEGARLNQEKGLSVDWDRFARAWRSQYAPSMDRVRRGELPWLKLDVLHRMILDSLLEEYELGGLDEQEREHLNRVWHRLQPWPDAVPGMTRMRTRYVLATLSNGNVSLLLNMAKHSGLPWDGILSAELAHAYKPDRQVYLMAADLLGLQPHELMMVAAHPGDLRAAQEAGLRAAYVPRPQEYGTEPEPAAGFDLVARDFIELAEKLGT